MKIKQYLQRQKQAVEEYLEKNLPVAEGNFKHHIEAIRYSLFVGGKRLRPILCLAGAEAVSRNQEKQGACLPVATALECIHTYSLIHDDLPAMDDDELRRGKPTNHVVFGEAAAILAGDGLLTYAFELLSSDMLNIPSESKVRIIHLIAQAAGNFGMVGGQSMDIKFEGEKVDYETLKTIHRSKTGALITASVVSGAIVAGADSAQHNALINYGKNVGLAFQIVDDILDVESTTEVLGKPVGSDEEANKVTYPLLFGLDNSRKMAREAVDNAVESLHIFDTSADPLRNLAEYILERNN